MLWPEGLRVGVDTKCTDAMEMGWDGANLLGKI